MASTEHRPGLFESDFISIDLASALVTLKDTRAMEIQLELVAYKRTCRGMIIHHQSFIS